MEGQSQLLYRHDMVYQLPLTVTPLPRETFPSFFARLAAANGTDAISFAMDMGGSLKRVVHQDAEMVKLVGQLAGITDEEMTTLLSWTGEPLGDVRMQYRGEVFVSRAVRNPVVRGCLRCLAEQAAAPGVPLANMAMQGHWLCRGVDICITHQQPLVPLWTEGNPVRREDMGAHLRTLLPDLTSMTAKTECVAVSAYDAWLDKRLSENQDLTWLRTQTSFAGMTMCLALGEDILRHQSLTPNDRAAKAAGFGVISSGPDAIRATVRSLLRKDDGTLTISKSPLKSLSYTLVEAYPDSMEFEDFRQIIRDELMTFWPIAPGDTLLGQVVATRRFHTIASAAEQTGLHKGLLQDILVAEGVFDPTQCQQTPPRTFDAEAYAAFLAEIPHLVPGSDIMTELGATETEFEALCAEGVLRPYLKTAKVLNRWRRADATALRETLTSRLRTKQASRNADTLLMTRRALGVRLTALIAAIQDGRLAAFRHDDQEGFHAIRVDRMDVEALIKTLPPDVLIDRPETKVISASVFGKQIGLVEPKYMVRLVATGHSPGTEITNSVTKRKQWSLAEDDIAAFHKRFTTTALLARKAGVHRRTITSQVQHHGTQPFSAGDEVFEGIYLLSDVQEITKTN